MYVVYRIHPLMQIIQKIEKYSRTLWLANVDYEKTFDTIESWAIPEPMQRYPIDCRYIQLRIG